MIISSKFYFSRLEYKFYSDRQNVYINSVLSNILQFIYISNTDLFKFISIKYYPLLIQCNYRFLDKKSAGSFKLICFHYPYYFKAKYVAMWLYLFYILGKSSMHLWILCFSAHHRWDKSKKTSSKPIWNTRVSGAPTVSWLIANNLIPIYTP